MNSLYVAKIYWILICGNRNTEENIQNMERGTKKKKKKKEKKQEEKGKKYVYGQSLVLLVLLIQKPKTYIK
jgi:hypothetical protein